MFSGWLFGIHGMSSLKTNKLDWDEALEWANFLVQDQDTTWWRYEYEPVVVNDGGPWTLGQKAGQMILAAEGTKGWKDTLEERPESYKNFTHLIDESGGFSMQIPVCYGIMDNGKLNYDLIGTETEVKFWG